MKPFGLVLSGGESSRMGRDKGSIIYNPHAVDQRTRCVELLKEVCSEVFVSVRKDQAAKIVNHLPMVEDQNFGPGPGNGILSANFFYPNQAWLVLACDFPFLNSETLSQLIRERDESKMASAFVDSDGNIEPLLTLWEPQAISALSADYAAGFYSPRKTLEQAEITRLIPSHPHALQNVNSPFHSF